MVHDPHHFLLVQVDLEVVHAHLQLAQGRFIENVQFMNTSWKKETLCHNVFNTMKKANFHLLRFFAYMLSMLYIADLSYVGKG